MSWLSHSINHISDLWSDKKFYCHKLKKNFGQFLLFWIKFFLNIVQIICLVYQKILREILYHPIYSEYFYDATLSFGETSKIVILKIFNRLYPTCPYMISTWSSPNIVLCTDYLPMAKIWARSETLSGTVTLCSEQSAVFSDIVS